MASPFQQEIWLLDAIQKVIGRICKSPPSLVVEFEKTDSFLARSWLRDGVYGIAISETCGLVLHDVLYRMMSLPGVFVEIGEASKEIPLLEPAYDKPPKSCADLFSDYDQYELMVPRCQIRTNYARSLAMSGLLAIVFHELSHILLGHLPVRGAGDVATLGLIAMEWSADVQAAEILALVHPDKTATGMTHVSRAAMIPLLMFNEESWDAPASSATTHPAPLDRVLAWLDAISKVATLRGIEWDPVSSDLHDVQRAYECLTGGRADPARVHHTLTDPRKAEQLEYWQRVVRPLCEPHAFIRLPTTGTSDDHVYS